MLQGVHVQLLHFLPRPGCFAQKLQTRSNTRVIFEAIDVYNMRHTFPAVQVDKMFEDRFQGDAVQRVVGLFFHIRGSKFFQKLLRFLKVRITRLQSLKRSLTRLAIVFLQIAERKVPNSISPQGRTPIGEWL